MEKKHPLELFLAKFIPEIARKAKQLNQAYWLLATTGHSDAADLQAEIDTELRVLLSDTEVYQELLEWDRDPSVKDPLLKRQLNVLIRTFKQNLIPRKLLEETSQREAALSQMYNQFRAEFEGKKVTGNEIREILKNEENPARRKKAWEASKQIGEVMAPKILELE